MSVTVEHSSIVEKTKELCEFIINDEGYKSHLDTVETFLNDDAARLLYQSVHERSEELRNKQQSGVELGEAEIEAFKEVRNQMEENSVVMDFLDAQDALQSMQMTVSQYVGMSLELGRVPTPEDIESAQGGGCCGGSGGGGCGC